MKLLGTLSAFLFSGLVAASSMHNIVIFGDSLSDNGNLYKIMNYQMPQSPPYYKGRFSNGPVWVEMLAASYFPNDPDTHLLDYAIGASGVSEEDDEDGKESVLLTLKKQLKTYLADHDDKANPDDLYIVWIGSNNYLGLPDDLEKSLIDVNAGIEHGIQLLVSKGAKHILVFNIPNLGRTPAATFLDRVDVMGYLAKEHNKRLAQTYASLKQAHPDVEWFYFDLGTMFDDVMDYPEKYAFTNITEGCVELVSEKSAKMSLLNMVARATPKLKQDACAGYLFFDLVHPTTYAHEKIAEKVRDMLDAEGVEFGS